MCSVQVRASRLTLHAGTKTYGPEHTLAVMLDERDITKFVERISLPRHGWLCASCADPSDETSRIVTLHQHLISFLNELVDTVD